MPKQRESLAVDTLIQSEEAILAAIDERETLGFLRRLVAFNTENPPGSEASVAEFLATELQGRGIDTELDLVMPGRSNLTARIGIRNGSRLLLNAHTDTMPAGVGWSHFPQEAQVRDGRLYGRGACDVKGGLASCVEAILAIQRSGASLTGEVVLDAVIDEEGGAAGTRRTVERGRTADWAIVMEPTDLRVLHIGNGQVNIELEFRGVAAHGSAPDDGRNAISDAAAFVAEVEAEAALFRLHPHPVLGPATYNVGTITGGVQTSIVPSRCVVTVDRRILPGQTPEDALADTNRILDRLRANRPGMDVLVRPLVTIRAIDEPATEPIAMALHRAVIDAGVDDPGLGGLRATSDAAYLLDCGIPVVIFGPGSISQSAHRPDEFVPLAELHRATRALALVASRLLGTNATE